MLLFLLGVVGLLKFLSGGEETTEAGGLDPALLLQLQTACFQSNPPLFYDDQGFCYAVDPATLTEADRIVQRVPPTPPVATTDDAAAPAAPAAPADPAAPTTAPAAPTTAAPAAPTTAVPAAPTTAAPTSAPTTTEASTTTAPTTTEAPPININVRGGWTWDVGFPDTLNGVPCVKDAQGKYPPGCQDAIMGNYSVTVNVVDGVVSGSRTIAQLGSKTATFSGSISPAGAVSMSVDVGNLGTFALNGTLTGTCNISGGYTHTSQNGSSTATGSFTLVGSSC